MSRNKKHTQLLFDMVRERPMVPESYGYLGLLYKALQDLTDIRIQKKLTQKDLAKLARIAQQNIARFEGGRSNPTLMQVIKVAHALGFRIKFERYQFPPGDYDAYKD
jgi:DNA-binding XRE family transcriptional regulator